MSLLENSSSISKQPVPGNSHSGMKTADRLPALIFVLLVAFTFLVFANIISHYFLMDDFPMLYSAKYNKFLHVLLLYDNIAEGWFFRPVPMFFFWLAYRVFGPNPIPYHIIKLLLHACCAFLAANLLYILFQNKRAAAMFGLVFVAFPNHTEVLHGPADDFNAWSSVFYLVTLNLFAYYRLGAGLAAFLASLVSLLAAIVSKESAFTLPLALVVTDYFVVRSRGLRPRVRSLVACHAAYFGLLFVSVLVIRKVFGMGAGYLTREGEDLISLYLGNIYVLTADLVRMYSDAWRYLFVPLADDIPFWNEIMYVVSIAIIVASVFLVLTRRINPAPFAYCLLFAVITLLPLMGTYRVVGLSHWFRLFYLPSIAGCYVISMIADAATEAIRKPWLKFVPLILILIPSIFLTKLYDQDWIEAANSNEKLVSALVEKATQLPRHSRIYVSGLPGLDVKVPSMFYSLPCAVALYCDREHVQVYLDYLPPVKVLALDRETYDTNDWHYFWLRWNSDTGQLETIKEIQPLSRGEIGRFVWEFGSPENQVHLEATRDIVRLDDSRLRFPAFVIDGPWAFLWLPRVSPQRPIKYLTIEMMLKGKGNRKDISRLFWVTETNRKAEGGSSIGFYVIADGGFHEYKIPLYRNGLSLIDPHIIRFALRPSQKAGTLFSIRKVSVEYY